MANLLAEIRKKLNYMPWTCGNCGVSFFSLGEAHCHSSCYVDVMQRPHILECFDMNLEMKSQQEIKSLQESLQTQESTTLRNAETNAISNEYIAEEASSIIAKEDCTVEFSDTEDISTNSNLLDFDIFKPNLTQFSNVELDSGSVGDEEDLAISDSPAPSDGEASESTDELVLDSDDSEGWPQLPAAVQLNQSFTRNLTKPSQQQRRISKKENVQFNASDNESPALILPEDEDNLCRLCFTVVRPCHRSTHIAQQHMTEAPFACGFCQEPIQMWAISDATTRAKRHLRRCPNANGASQCSIMDRRSDVSLALCFSWARCFPLHPPFAVAKRLTRQQRREAGILHCCLCQGLVWRRHWASHVSAVHLDEAAFACADCGRAWRVWGPRLPAKTHGCGGRILDRRGELRGALRAVWRLCFPPQLRRRMCLENAN